MNLLHATRTDYDRSFFDGKLEMLSWILSGITKKVIVFLFFSFSTFSIHANFLNCPDDLTITLDPCEEFFEMDFSQVDWSSNVQLSETIFNPENGTELYPGNHAGSIIAIDLLGDTSVCVFNIQVVSLLTPMVCKNLVEISLENDCQQEITFEDVLETGIVFCEEDLNIRIQSAIGSILAQGPVVYGNIDWIDNYKTISIVNTTTGNMCWGNLSIIQPTLMKIDCPENKSIFCVESTDPVMTGVPSFETCFADSEIDLTFHDQIDFRHCPDSIDFELTRVWNIENPFGETAQCQQVITAFRYDPKNVLFPFDFDGIAQSSFECLDGYSYLEISDTSQTGIPTLNGYSADKASCDFSISFQDSVQNICGESYHIDRYWKVIDWCSGQITRDTQTIIIEDTKAPEFEIVDTIWVSSTIDCGNDVEIPPAFNLNECDEIDFEIELPWATLNTNGGVGYVVLGNGVQEAKYTLTDGCGNASTKTAIIVVEPETLLECPPDVTVDCSFYYAELESPILNNQFDVLDQFGMPVFYSNCFPEFNIGLSMYVDDCGVGVVERTLTTNNFINQKSCTQNIFVEHLSDFTVTFPKDLEINCNDYDGTFDGGEPIIKSADCENIEVTYTDWVSTFGSDACIKIYRTWTVKNLCIYDSVLNNFTVETPESMLGLYPECDIDGDGACSSWTYKDGVRFSPFEGSVPDGIITHKQVIKIQDDQGPLVDPDFEMPIICAEENCVANFSLPVPEYIDCADVQISISGDFIWGLGPYTNVGIGEYEVIYEFVDECGNTSVLQEILIVENCGSPEVICKTNPKITIKKPYFQATVHALDLVEENQDCTSMPQFAFSNDLEDDFRSFHCFELGDYLLDVVAISSNGEKDTCQTTLTVHDPQNNCDDLPHYIDGAVFDEKELFVSGFDMYLHSPTTGYMDSLIDYQSGNFAFNDVELNEDYVLTPKKDKNPLNGVTTFDMVLIQKHVLNVLKLDSPYKMIAADANNSGTITISDVVEIKKLILHINPTFPKNDSWRFVDFSYEFPNPQNPWEEPFPEIVELSPFVGISDCIFFIGMKIGDVNGNANLNDLLSTDDRSNLETFDVQAPNFEFKKGDLISVPFFMNEAEIAGYQFTIEFNKTALKFQEILPNKAQKTDFGMRYLEDGYLTANWINSGTEKIKENIKEPMFTMVFLAKSDGVVEDLIQINSEYTIAEAYSNDLEILNVQMSFREALESEFQVFLPHPNPFSDESNIGFNLPENSNVEIKCFNSAGKLVYLNKKWFQKGLNYLKINRKKIPENGIYYFELKTKNEIKSGKLILID